MQDSMYAPNQGQSPAQSAILAKTLAWLNTQKMPAAKITLEYLLEREHQRQLGNSSYGYRDEGLLARFGAGLLLEEPIELADKRAQAEYIQEYQRLLKRAAAHIELGMYAEAEKLQGECAEIQKHLRAISYKGKLKKATDCGQKHRQSVRLKLKYLETKAEKYDPEIARFLRELLH